MIEGQRHDFAGRWTAALDRANIKRRAVELRARGYSGRKIVPRLGVSERMFRYWIAKDPGFRVAYDGV